MIEPGQFLFSYEGGSLMSPDFVRGEGFRQPRAAADEAAVQYLTASEAAMDAGTIWSGPAVPAGAGSNAGTSEEGVSVANDLTALAPHPAATGPDRPPVTFRPGVTSVSAGFFSWDMIANEVI